MFSLRKDRSDILESCLYTDRNFYKKFYRDFRKAKHSVHIESPFLTKARTYELIRASKKTKARITVNTRHPSHQTGQMRVDAVKCIRFMKRYGIRVRTFKDRRHYKIAVIDEEILWEGSLNILSQSRSREIMRRTENQGLCMQINQVLG